MFKSNAHMISIEYLLGMEEKRCEMKAMKSQFIGILSMVLFLGAIDTFSQRKPQIRQAKKSSSARANNYKIETGEKIRVRLEDEINSKSSRKGETFRTKVTEPVYSNTGVIVIPAGSSITGRIDQVTPAQKGGDPGTIDVSFYQLRLPNGTTRTINGSLSNLDSDKATSDNEGTASGGKMKHRKIIFIGGGTAGGAILGGVIGGGKGALIGGIIGAVGGIIGEKSIKGKDAVVKSGTEFGVYINQPFYLPKFVGTDIYEEEETVNQTENVGTTGSRTYIVQRGDTLGGISRKMYGTSSRYMDIYNANRDRLSSPNSVEVGQELLIP